MEAVLKAGSMEQQKAGIMEYWNVGILIKEEDRIQKTGVKTRNADSHRDHRAH